MNLETVSKEIFEIRRRLQVIEDERTALPLEALVRRERLRDEEQELSARLIDLQDSFSRPAGEAAFDTAFIPLASRQNVR
ncbi:MAG TPA: hypothetical protein VF115_16440 [Acidimicrobiia bacterium]